MLCHMLPKFETDGNLPIGIHWATWPEFETRFGTNGHRKELLAGMKNALLSLQRAGCKAVYVNGSFVTAKKIPGDFDACWDPNGVDLRQLDPLLTDSQDFQNERKKQKMKFRGEFFPNILVNQSFLEFFQGVRGGGRKGIVGIRLGDLI